MIAWGMVYAIVVGLPVLLAATVCARFMREQGRQERAVWLVALALAVALPVFALVRSGVEAPAVPVPSSEIGLIGLPTVVEVPAAPVVRVPVAPTPIDLDAILVAFWALVSLTLTLRWAVASARLRSLSGAWPADTLDGVGVLLTSDFGPAVAGLLDPRIVVPTWLLSLPDEQRTLVLVHEQEHIGARDPVLIAVARLARITMPWNPIVWLLSARLDRAIELDCDRRVLRRRPDVRAYGATLLTVSSRSHRGFAGATAFAQSEAPLRRRILAMTTPPRTVSILSLLTALVLGTLLVVGAFEIPIPTIRMQLAMEPGTPEGLTDDAGLPDVSRDDAATGPEDVTGRRISELQDQLARLEERQAVTARQTVTVETLLRELTEGSTVPGAAVPSGTLTGSVHNDGRPVEHVQIHIPGTGFGTLSNGDGRMILAGVPVGQHRVVAERVGYGPVVRTVDLREGETVALDFELEETAVPVAGVVVSGTRVGEDISFGQIGTGAVRPLVYVDGIRIRNSPWPISVYLEELRETSGIDRIEVIREGAAKTLYGEDAAGGVIQIFLKQNEPESPRPSVASAAGRPTFTPFTVAPEVRNLDEVRAAILDAYPEDLRDDGIGGTVYLYFYIDGDGTVQDHRVQRSSGHQALDDAAVAVAPVYRFSPALNRDERVPVWIILPITFLQEH